MSHDSYSSIHRPTSIRWHIVALLVGYSFMTWFNRVGMSVAYTEHIKDETGIAPTDMGWVYSAFLISYTIFMTPGGWLIDRWGPKAALVIMGFGSAVFCALTAVAGLPTLIASGSVLAALLIIRTVMGVFTAPIYPAASRMLANWVPVGQRTLANGSVQCAAAVGIAFSYHLFGALMDLVGWQMAFLVAGAVSGLLALLWTIYVADHPGQHRSVNLVERELRGGASEARAVSRQTTTSAESWTTVDSIALQKPWYMLLMNRNLVLLTLSYAAVGYVEYLFYFWAQYYFKDVLHLPTNDSRTYSMILMLSLGGGMVLGGWLSDRLRMSYGGRWSRVAVPMLGLFASGAFLILGVLAESTVAIVVLLSLAHVAVGTTEAPTWTMAVELGGRQGGTAAAICNTSGNAVGLVAPILTPYVGEWVARQFEVSEIVGWQWAIGLGSAIAIVGALFWLGINPRDDASNR